VRRPPAALVPVRQVVLRHVGQGHAATLYSSWG
jgi:hypothetical protein